MSVSANQPIRAQNPGNLRSGPVDTLIHLYQGTIAFFERTSGASEGYVTDTADSGSNDFAGIVYAEKDNSAGSAGDKDAELYTSGSFVLYIAAANQGYVGDKAYATDNFTVTASSSSATLIGKFTEYIDATHMRVELGGADTDV